MTTGKRHLDDFMELVARVRSEHPNWFRLRGDLPATVEQLDAVERSLGCRLPEDYREFLAVFGGHDFAFVSIYSADPESRAYVVSQNATPWLEDAKFVAFADNGGGDYYGWVVSDGMAADQVMLLDHSSGEVVPSDFEDFLDFVKREGLRYR